MWSSSLWQQWQQFAVLRGACNLPSMLVCLLRGTAWSALRCPAFHQGPPAQMLSCSHCLAASINTSCNRASSAACCGPVGSIHGKPSVTTCRCHCRPPAVATVALHCRPPAVATVALLPSPLPPSCHHHCHSPAIAAVHDSDVVGMEQAADDCKVPRPAATGCKCQGGWRTSQLPHSILTDVTASSQLPHSLL